MLMDQQFLLHFKSIQGYKQVIYLCTATNTKYKVYAFMHIYLYRYVCMQCCALLCYLKHVTVTSYHIALMFGLASYQLLFTNQHTAVTDYFYDMTLCKKNQLMFVSPSLVMDNGTVNVIKGVLSQLVNTLVHMR